jgi:hypothetical protein
MKNLIAVIIVLSVWALPAKVAAQINEDKMDKDLRVASKVLETLTQGEENIIMYGGGNIEGNYIEGYGVVFSIASSDMYGRQKFEYRISRGVSSGSGVAVVAPVPPLPPKGKAKEKEKVESTDFGAIMVEFLADYSQLIGQLKPTDKIVVSTKKSEFIYVTTDEYEEISEGGNSSIAAEMLKKDHNEYMVGKISHDQLVAKIKVTKNEGDDSRSKDLDMFGSMLGTLYNESYTDTYFMSWRANYERIKGVGVIYAFKVFSSYDEDGLYRMPGIDKKGLTDEARNENVVKLYPQFVSGMKENMIQYGRTIKSLEDDEMLILKITLTKCDECSIPKKIQLSVKQSVLSSFNSGKIKLAEAISSVKVTDIK